MKDAVSQGAKVIVGGNKHDRGGNFYQATLLADVSTEMRVVKEEIFGPVAAAIRSVDIGYLLLTGKVFQLIDMFGNI